MRPDAILLSPAKDPRLMGPLSGPKRIGYCVKTQFSWVPHQDPRFYRLRFLNIIICIINIIFFIISKGINIKNSIICVINIIIFIIIKSINIKNSIICVTNIIIIIIIIIIIDSFNIKNIIIIINNNIIKNIIICIINSIIFIIINIINKIINKFENNYYQYWKTTIDLIWRVKLKIIIIVIIKHGGLL